jgi:hypothetical protein
MPQKHKSMVILSQIMMDIIPTYLVPNTIPVKKPTFASN